MSVCVCQTDGTISIPLNVNYTLIVIIIIIKECKVVYIHINKGICQNMELWAIYPSLHNFR